ncbi:MAG: DUF3380 domain-containing protein [Rhodobacteraceae bacterium]|nr:DUF3380 domain-containing protein [Paracoccaceae bacterium]
MFHWHFKPLTFPQTLNTFVIHPLPTGGVYTAERGQPASLNKADTRRYPRLIEAMKINSEAALRSASWGLGQVMGFNCSLCRYSSAKDMVTDFLDSEGAQLEAMVQFIISAERRIMCPAASRISRSCLVVRLRPSPNR